MKNDILTDNYGVQEALELLGVKEINNGASTGTKWFDTTGEIIDS